MERHRKIVYAVIALALFFTGIGVGYHTRDAYFRSMKYLKPVERIIDVVAGEVPTEFLNGTAEPVLVIERPNVQPTTPVCVALPDDLAGGAPLPTGNPQHPTSGEPVDDVVAANPWPGNLRVIGENPLSIKRSLLSSTARVTLNSYNPARTSYETDVYEVPPPAFVYGLEAEGGATLAPDGAVAPFVALRGLVGHRNVQGMAGVGYRSGLYGEAGIRFTIGRR
jgi:hypothetical protein